MGNPGGSEYPQIWVNPAAFKISKLPKGAPPGRATGGRPKAYFCSWRHFLGFDWDFGIPGGIENLSTPRVIKLVLPAGGPKPTGPHVFYGTKSRAAKFGFVMKFYLAAGGKPKVHFPP